MGTRCGFLSISTGGKPFGAPAPWGTGCAPRHCFVRIRLTDPSGSNNHAFMSSSEHSGEPPRENQPSSAPIPAPAPAVVTAPTTTAVPTAVRVAVPVPAPLPATTTVPAPVPVPVPAPASDAAVAAELDAEPAPAPAPPPEPEPVVRYVPNEVDVSLRVLLALLVIGFGVWVVLSWLKYDKSAAQTEEGWHKGSRQLIEVTLVREDANKLSCASNFSVEGLNCGYLANSQARVPPPPDDAHLLRPYCNVKNDVLLAAGLWDSPGLRGPLPTERFTVMCNYDIVGVLKSVSLRWSPNDKFEPAKQGLPVGILKDCVIPQ